MATPLRPRVLGLSTYSAEISKSFTLLSSFHRPYNISPLKEGFLRGRNLKFSKGLSSIRPSGRKEGFTVEAVVKRSPKRLKYSSPPFRKGDRVLYVKIDPSGVDAWRLEPVIELLKHGAVGIIPTDTVYAFVSDVKNPMAVERIHRIKGMDTKKPLSILCHSFRDIDTYTTGLPCGNSQGQANIFRAARQCLPGPYTFVLPASKELPKQCVRSGTSRAKHVSRKCVGVRIPNDAICQAILEKLDGPLLCSSVRTADDEWIIDPVVIADIYGASMGQEGVDFIVDGGVRVADPSTVVDMTGSEPILLRKGKNMEAEPLSDGQRSSREDSPIACLPVEAGTGWLAPGRELGLDLARPASNCDPAAGPSTLAGSTLAGPSRPAQEGSPDAVIQLSDSEDSLRFGCRIEEAPQTTDDE